MNLQIQQGIASKIGAPVTYSTDKDGVTTYTATKDINGKPATANVPVSADVHAATTFQKLVELVVDEFKKLFAAIRAEFEKPDAQHE